MSDDAAVVWLEAGDAQRESHTRALDEWARAHGIRLVQIEDASSASVSASGAVETRALGDRVEKELDRAREAIGGADGDAAERALARAETVLREHPELPEAAWLRAEVERAWSARFLRIEPKDEARARTAWENAAAIDGGRAAGVGETAFPARPKTKATIVVTGHVDALFVDGKSVPGKNTYEVDVATGEHQVTATTKDRIVFASWIAFGTTPATLAVGDSESCGRADMGEVKRAGDQIVAKDVSCGHWIAATHGDRPGSILVARCERDACGPLLEWRTDTGAIAGPLPTLDRGRGWPGWATWLIVGIGTGAAASVALAASGAFDKRTVEPRFVVGGAKSE